MEGEANVGLLRFRHHRLQKVLGSLQLIGAGVRANVFARWQVLRQLVVVRRVPGARAADLFLVPFDQSMRVEVVLDDRQASPARRSDRRDDIRDLCIRASPAPDDIVEPGNHHVAERQAAGPKMIEAGAHVGFGPRDLGSARQHVLDADLFHAPHPGVVKVGSDAEADLRRCVAF
jgi:hypothetical protein